MSTNDIHQTSTPDADICGELRTKSGQDECSGDHPCDHFGWCDKHRPNLPPGTDLSHEYARELDTPPAPAAVEEVTITQPLVPQRIDLTMNAAVGLPVWNGIGQPGSVMPLPAERPTPITDYQIIFGELAEARTERDTAMRRANKLAAEALALTEQRDRLADKMRIIRGDGGEASPVNLYEAQGIACEAISELIAAVKKPTTEELEIAGFRITADPSIPPGTGIIRDPQSGETLTVEYTPPGTPPNPPPPAPPRPK